MVKRYYGGVISATQATVNPGSASGLYNISQQMQAKQAGSWPLEYSGPPTVEYLVIAGGGAGGSGVINYSLGGGGGAGAAGTAFANTYNAVAGGAGLNTWSAWATATSTGVSNYYAGGGAGYPAYNTSGQNVTSANGGAGGGGSTVSGSSNPGVSNTGSGGSAAANGGSGLVIVRYLRSVVGG